MALSAKALREQRNAVYGQMRALSDTLDAEKKPNFTAEEEERWKRINADYDALTRQIEIAERVDTLGAQQKELVGELAAGRHDVDPRELAKRASNLPRGLWGLGSAALIEVAGWDGAMTVEQVRCQAFSAWCRNQAGRPVTEADQACTALAGFNMRANGIDFSLLPTDVHSSLRRKVRRTREDRREEFADYQIPNYGATMTWQLGTTGGYTVPPETLLRSLEINMLWYGGMRQVADSIRTATGERISWPTVDDTTNTGALLGESTSIGSSVDPTFGKVYWDAYKFSSKPVLVPYELLEDSAFNLAAVLGELLGIRLGRITNTKYTTGTGNAMPKGLITAATQFTAASSTALGADDLIGLIHSVDPAYRQLPGVSFMFHDKVLLAIRKLKDGLGQYLWMSGLQQGVPDRLLSYSFTVNQDMDSTFASGKNTVAFGALDYYKIRTVGQGRFYRLQERYRDTDQDAFIMLIREDGNLLAPGTAPVEVLHHT